MPYPNEHAQRINEPNKYVKFARKNNEFGEGIDVIYGVTSTGKSEIQAIRFDKTKFSEKAAREWLTKHGYTNKGFEPAAKTDSVDDSIIRNVQRFDFMDYRGEVKKTDEGFLIIDAPIAKAGVYTYMLPDGSLQRDLVTKECLENTESLNTLSLKPVTNVHPPEMLVSISTSKYRKIGQVGESNRVVGDKLFCRMVVDTEEGITAITEEGRRELSPGYICDYIIRPGVFEGQEYDVIQINRRYNHVAIVDNARGGKELAIKIDSADKYDAVMSVKDDSEQSDGIYNVSEKDNGGNMLPTYRLLDGKDYEASSEIITHIGELRAKLDSANAEIGELKKDAENRTVESKKLEAERDALKVKVDGFEKIDIDAKIKEGVRERIALEKVASKVLKDDVKIDEMDNASLKKAIIVTKYPNAAVKLDSEANAYLDTFYTIITEDIIDKVDKNEIDEQNADSNYKVDGGQKTDARQAYIDYFDNLHKKGAK